MKYRIMLSIEVETRAEAEAYRHAEKLLGLLKSPLVRMAVEGEGIKLSGDGHPIVYAPQPQ